MVRQLLSGRRSPDITYYCKLERTHFMALIYRLKHPFIANAGHTQNA